MCNPTADWYILLVPITSCKNEQDDTACILRADDHSFIKRDSYVFYRYAKAMYITALLRGINTGNFSLKTPIDEMIFNKIHRGFYKSKFTGKFTFEYRPNKY